MSRRRNSRPKSNNCTVCDNFNARCGGLQGVDDANGVLHGRISIDLVANEQGELLAECLQSSGFCFVNGQNGSDDFTCIFAKGASVVDCCIVSVEELNYVTNVSVITMSTCEEVLCYQEGGYRIPDHSLLRWDLTVGTCVHVSREEDSDKVSDNKSSPSTLSHIGTWAHDDDQIFIQPIMDDLRIVQGDQDKLDEGRNQD